MNRFQEKFLRNLADFCEEHGYVIVEDGYIEPIRDWVDPKTKFHFVTEEDDDEIKIVGVEME